MSRGLPQTDSIQELAQFWDTHDLTEFADELEEVIEPVFERETVVEIHFHQRKQRRSKESRDIGASIRLT